MRLTRREKTVLRWIKEGSNEPPPYQREIMEAVTSSLADKELIRTILTKCMVSGRLLPKAHLLFADNPKLKNKPSPEIIRWTVTTIIATIAAVASIISCLK